MSIENLQLINPTTDFKQEYLAFIAEFVERQEPAMFYRLPGEDFAAFVAQLGREARGEGLEDWMVPQHTFWAVRDGQMVGVLKLRHRLTPALENRGGHIGYFVHPSARGQGIATRMLALALLKARALGITRVFAHLRHRQPRLRAGDGKKRRCAHPQTAQTPKPGVGPACAVLDRPGGDITKTDQAIPWPDEHYCRETNW